MLDARMIRHSGIGTYLRGLVSGFQGNSFFEKVKLGFAIPDSLSGEIKEAGLVSRFNAPVYSVQEQLQYPRQIARCRLWHAPHYNIPLTPIPSGTGLVVTVHDLIHWIFRKEFFSPLQALYAGLLLKRVVKRADRIIAVSQRTREDLMQHFKAPREKIDVIYEGVNEDFFERPSPEESRKLLQNYQLPQNFFLYVGLLKPHKNVHRLISLFQKLKRAGRLRSELVIVGKKDERYPRGYELLQNLQSGEGLHYFSSVRSPRELKALYALAKALVHPSLYEGFGLTVLESMAVGTPVICSRAASLPEVAGEAASFIEPHSDSSLEKALIQMEEDQPLRESLAQRGKIQARKFSWKQAADETVRVYQKVRDSR